MEQLTPGMFLVGFLILILVIYMFNSVKCNSEQYAPTGYKDSCEFSYACAYNSGQTCTLSGNRAGNCTLHGLCCPSFSTDNTRMQELGLSEGEVGYRYQRMLEDDMYD